MNDPITLFASSDSPTKQLILRKTGPRGGPKYVLLGPLTRERIEQLKAMLDEQAEIHKL